MAGVTGLFKMLFEIVFSASASREWLRGEGDPRANAVATAFRSRFEAISILLYQCACWISSGFLWYSSILLGVVAGLTQGWHVFANVRGLIRPVGRMIALRLRGLPSGRIAAGL